MEGKVRGVCVCVCVCVCMCVCVCVLLHVPPIFLMCLTLDVNIKSIKKGIVLLREEMGVTVMYGNE